MLKIINRENSQIQSAVLDQIVYLIKRDGTYQQTAHRISNLSSSGDSAVTYCQVWLRDYAVGAREDDCFVWCERGCKPLPTDTQP